jgi:hypothetical protein
MEVATLTVIGTLRPTERRRAMNCYVGKEYANKSKKILLMELRGIEPLTSALRRQRSPS